MKKRVLLVNEASFMNTGFAVQALECLKRLHATNKYELAELGSYVEDKDPRGLDLDWKFYGSIPTQEGTLAHKRYYSSQEGQFGAAVFEDVLLDFQPDIVVHARDPWMSDFEIDSPFRKYYKSVWIPTIDGEPQRTKWIDQYRTPDLLMTHSRFAKEILERQAPDIKVFALANPGVDENIYKPLDQAKCREHLGLPKDANIILTVMRNQKRKLFPDLLEMFKEFLAYCEKNKKTELAKNTYLYLHTSYPDVGYDISRLILQNGLSHKVFVSYYCRNCRSFYADHFQTEMTVCKNCGQLACILPNTQHGLTREELPIVYNSADLYIQYSICEGLGMPICEAKACGIPVMALDYSAMSEHCECLGTWKLKVERHFHETCIETEQARALPDNEDTYRKIFVFFTNYKKEQRNSWKEILRQDAIDNFSFNRSAKIIEDAIDSLEIYDRNDTWRHPLKRLINTNIQIPDRLSNGEFVDFMISEYLKQPERIKTEWRNELVKGLNVGYINDHAQKRALDRSVIHNIMEDMIRANNFWETMRIAKLEKAQNKERLIEWSLV